VKTECEEIADNMRAEWAQYCTQRHMYLSLDQYAQAPEHADKFARAKLPGESETVIANVAYALLHK